MVAMRTGAADDRSFRPGTLVTHAEGSYSLVYSDFPLVREMHARGVPGSGYTWHALVMHLLKDEPPQITEALFFDPEERMFCAVSSNLDALRVVARALATLEDPDVLAHLVTIVDFSAYD